jgi:alkyl hydroperoxide reductase subunit AhpC
MATLVVPALESGSALDSGVSTQSLPEWLADDWALVFSHPRDFRDDSIEADRWLRIVRDAFRDRGVRPLALSSSACEPERGWVSEVTSDDSLVWLPASCRSAAADGLRTHIQALRGRFVLIIDSHLEPRGILRYVHSPARPMSPLDLLGSFDSMRRHKDPAGELHGQRRAFIPC